MIRRLLGTTALAVTLAAATAAQAQQTAQQPTVGYGGLIAFGDSLSDNGNAYAAAGAAGVPVAQRPAGPPYGSAQYPGRFSNGRVWTEYFAALNGISNPAIRAFGGARAANPADTNPAQDVPEQVTAYLAANPSINPNALITLWAGANDLLGTLQTGGNPVTAATAALTSLSQQVGRLAAAGGRNFALINLPNLGVIPLTSGFSASQRNDIANLVGVYNTNLANAAASLRAQTGANIIVVDVASLFADVLARPAVYGLTNLTTPCVNGTGAGGSPTTGACATAAAADAALYYDLLHPTTAAHQQVAGFVNGTLVTAELTPQALVVAPQLGLDLFREAGEAVAARAAGARSGTGGVGILESRGGTDGRWGLYSFGSWTTGDIGAIDGQLGYDYDGFTAGVGVDYQVDEHLTAGIAASYGSRDAQVGRAIADIEASAYTLQVYATAQAGALWVDADMAYAYAEYDLDRRTGFATLPTGSGDTVGHTFGGGARAGWTFQAGPFGLGPYAGLRYASTDLEGYTESAAGPLALTVDAWDAESLTSQLGVQFAGRITPGADFSFIPTAEIAWEREYKNDSRTVRATLPGGQLAQTRAGTPDENRFVGALGMALELDNGLMAALGYQTVLGSDDVDEHRLNARLRYSF